MTFNSAVLCMWLGMLEWRMAALQRGGGSRSYVLICCKLTLYRVHLMIGGNSSIKKFSYIFLSIYG